MSNIVLNGLTYVGNGISNSVSHWYERSAGLVSGFRWLTARVIYGAREVTTNWRLSIPVLAAEDSTRDIPGTVLYINRTEVSVRYDRRATAAERTATLQAIKDLVASAQFESSITSLVQPE